MYASTEGYEDWKGTLVFSYIRRLKQFLGFKIFGFNIFGSFRKMNIFWGMIKFWIFLGVITKLECFGVVSINFRAFS